VIEHTRDPAAFLGAMARFARPEGTVCVICPFGDSVSLELLFLDHLYTIRKANLRQIFETAGLKPATWARGPAGLNEVQRMTGRPSAEAIPISAYGCPTTLLETRDAHIRQWQGLDARLSSRLEDRGDVLCFGAGETSDLLKALIPQTWKRIAGHVVDPVPISLRNSSYRGKPLFYMDDPQLVRYDTVLLGVKPHYQKMLYSRLRERFSNVICWDDLVQDRVEVGSE
jgi:hypothetical protein